MPGKLGVNDHLRAILVALHMVALLAMCLPAPGKLGTPQQKDPGFQAQLKQWRGALSAVGIELTQDQTLDLVIDVADGMRTVRKAGLSFAKPYVRRVGAGQSWQMFGMLNRTPGRFRLEIEEDGEWRDLYVHANGTADWNARLLRSERMRALLNNYAWRRRLESYERFGQWLGCEAKRELPDATRVRTRIEVMALPKPAALRRTGEIPVKSSRWERTHNLAMCDGSPP